MLVEPPGTLEDATASLAELRRPGLVGRLEGWSPEGDLGGWACPWPLQGPAAPLRLHLVLEDLLDPGQRRVIAELMAVQTRPDLLGRCCNGTRVAGDAWVECDSFGWITLCCGCNRVIPPKWLLTKEQRQEMSANGMDAKQLVELNKVLLAEEQEMKAEAVRAQEK